MREIVLASTSPYRRALLERIGLPFAVVAPRYEESTQPGIEPEALVLREARGKAESVAGDRPRALIIGSDQIVALGNQTLGKPGTVERAVEQLRAMRGREHRLLTGVVVVDATSGHVGEHLEVTRVRVRDLGDEEIHAYVRKDRPLDCAGSYRAEGLGIVLFEYVRGEDPTAIEGMGLIGLVRLLAQRGVEPSLFT